MKVLSKWAAASLTYTFENYIKKILIYVNSVIFKEILWNGEMKYDLVSFKQSS